MRAVAAEVLAQRDLERARSRPRRCPRSSTGRCPLRRAPSRRPWRSRRRGSTAPRAATGAMARAGARPRPSARRRARAAPRSAACARARRACGRCAVACSRGATARAPRGAARRSLAAAPAPGPAASGACGSGLGGGVALGHGVRCPDRGSRRRIAVDRSAYAAFGCPRFPPLHRARRRGHPGQRAAGPVSGRRVRRRAAPAAALVHARAAHGRARQPARRTRARVLRAARRRRRDLRARRGAADWEAMVGARGRRARRGDAGGGGGRMRLLPRQRDLLAGLLLCGVGPARRGRGRSARAHRSPAQAAATRRGCSSCSGCCRARRCRARSA